MRLLRTVVADFVVFDVIVVVFKVVIAVVAAVAAIVMIIVVPTAGALIRGLSATLTLRL